MSPDLKKITMSEIKRQQEANPKQNKHTRMVLRHIIIKFLEASDKEKTFKSSHNICDITYNNNSKRPLTFCWNKWNKWKPDKWRRDLWEEINDSGGLLMVLVSSGKKKKKPTMQSLVALSTL